ncbi:hypothetical protein CYMTET_37836 [Cymbomonas tetramitiformis]|uniref:Uncharacterized protein n=1 Tax=Cymbomonas tetramitiformis TaxID=36881 RepID=A0AAE0CEW6_9CHLO|nr:hypothetical protein CYMTET_37836 [Cymbomonas tetramitiformis]
MFGIYSSPSQPEPGLLSENHSADANHETRFTQKHQTFSEENVTFEYRLDTDSDVVLESVYIPQSDFLASENNPTVPGLSPRRCFSHKTPLSVYHEQSVFQSPAREYENTLNPNFDSQNAARQAQHETPSQDYAHLSSSTPKDLPVEMEEPSVKTRETFLGPAVNKTLKVIDPYAMKEVEPSNAGGVLFVLFVLPLTLAYGCLLFFSHLEESREIACDVNTKWSAYADPFLLKVQCVSPSGCFVSSAYQKSTNACIEQLSEDDQDCVYLKYEETDTLRVCYTSIISDGIFAFWNTEVSEYGVQTLSDMLMKDGSIMDTPSLIEHGVFSLSYVETNNHTAAGSGKLRREFFSDFTSRSISLTNATPCLGMIGVNQTADALSQLQYAYPDQGAISASAIRIHSSFTDIECSRDDGAWVRFFGELGGFGGMLLSAGHVILQIWTTFRGG